MSKKGPIRLFAFMSGVSSSVGYVNRIDVGAGRSLEEVKQAVEEQLGMRLTVISSWQPESTENAVALIRLLRRDPGAADVLSSMLMAFKSTKDPSDRSS